MGQVLHGSATTTHAIRATMQRGNESDSKDVSSDHVHVLLSIPSNRAESDVTRLIKG
jgi:hypothetical protein